MRRASGGNSSRVPWLSGGDGGVWVAGCADPAAESGMAESMIGSDYGRCDGDDIWVMASVNGRVDVGLVSGRVSESNYDWCSVGDVETVTESTGDPDPATKNVNASAALYAKNVCVGETERESFGCFSKKDDDVRRMGDARVLYSRKKREIRIVRLKVRISIDGYD